MRRKDEEHDRCEREGLVRGVRGAIWVSKFNSTHEKATESEQESKREKEQRHGTWEVCRGAKGPGHLLPAAALRLIVEP